MTIKHANRNEKVIYTALFLDQESQEKLLALVPPAFEKTYAHHVTLEFRPKDGTSGTTVGRDVNVMANGVVIDEEIGAQAILIDYTIPGKKHSHITISTREGVAPTKSNDAIEKAVATSSVKYFEEPIEIKTIEGYFNGQEDIKKLK